MQFKKNSTVGSSQSNARKYNRQYKLANQRKVLLTIHQKVVGWWRFVGERSWPLAAVNIVTCFWFAAVLFWLFVQLGRLKRKKVWPNWWKYVLETFNNSWKCTEHWTLAGAAKITKRKLKGLCAGWGNFCWWNPYFWSLECCPRNPGIQAFNNLPLHLKEVDCIVICKTEKTLVNLLEVS